MTDETFEPGDHVEILCKDGATFVGRLVDITDLYVMLNTPAGRRGYCDVVALTHA